MNTSKTIVFFGNERLVSGLKSTSTPILRMLINDGYKIAAVVSHHSDGQSRNNRILEVAELAATHNIPVLTPDRPRDIYDQLVAYHADAAVLVAYGRIIPQDVIDIFPGGIINIHPSLLPIYRGPTPIESAISNGDSQTGVSIMQLTAGMDEGPVYTQRTVSLLGNESKFDLYDVLVNESASALHDTLPLILDGSLAPTEQESSHATYSKLLTNQDSILSPDVLTAVQAERKVRAHLVFPKTKMTIMGHDIIITQSHVSDTKNTPLDIECHDGAFLCIDELIAPSGKTMSASAFINGYAAG
jgi:methionyl-tRNA formyltransferase